MMDGNSKAKSGVKIKYVILALILAAVLPSIILQRFLMLMYVPSESMVPTLEVGNALLGTRNVSEVERGDIVAFQAETCVMIKRVIGLPGESVLIDEDGQVLINGIVLDEPYVVYDRIGQQQTFEVPEDCVFLLGDNRENSYDARYWDDPYTPIDAILAEAKYKLFS